MKKDNIIVDRDLFEWLVDYALDLHGHLEWQKDSIPRYEQDYKQREKHIKEAVKIRDKKK